MSQEDQKFDTKFLVLVNTIEKSSQDHTNLKTNIESEYIKIKNILSQKVELSCKDTFQKILLYSEMPKETDNNIDNLIPVEGLENEFNNSKNEYINCTLNYKAILDRLIFEVDVINLIGFNSYILCLDQCKAEVKSLNLNENDAKKCITTCSGYRNMNTKAAYDVIMENIDKTKEFLNKL